MTRWLAAFVLGWWWLGGAAHAVSPADYNTRFAPVDAAIAAGDNRRAEGLLGFPRPDSEDAETLVRRAMLAVLAGPLEAASIAVKRYIDHINKRPQPEADAVHTRLLLVTIYLLKESGLPGEAEEFRQNLCKLKVMDCTAFTSPDYLTPQRLTGLFVALSRSAVALPPLIGRNPEEDLRRADDMLRAGRTRALAQYHEFSPETRTADVGDARLAKELRLRRTLVLFLLGRADLALPNIDLIKKNRAQDAGYGAFTWEDDMRLRLLDMYLMLRQGKTADAERMRAEYCQRTPGGCTVLTAIDTLTEDQLLRTFLRLSRPGTAYPKLMGDLLSAELGRPVTITATTMADVDAEVARLREEQRVGEEARRAAEEQRRLTDLRAEAEARERARLEFEERQRAAEAERAAEQARQMRLAREEADRQEQARQAAARQAEMERRATFPYRAGFVGRALLRSGVEVWRAVPGWAYAFLLVGVLLHRHWALRLTGGLVAFFAAAIVGVGVASGDLPGLARYVALVPVEFPGWFRNALAKESEGAGVAYLGQSLTLLWPHLSLLGYAAARLGVGEDARRAERRRWRAAFDMPMLLADRVAFWWQERQFRRTTHPQPAPAAGAATAPGGYRSRIPLGEYGKFGFWMTRTALMLFLFYVVYSGGGELWRALLQAMPGIIREPIAAGADWVSKQVREAPEGPAALR